MTNNKNMIMATKTIIEDCDEARLLKNQIKTLQALLDAKLDNIKSYMGESEVLLGLKGEHTVTYRYSAPRLVLNTEMLKADYIEIYNACCEQRPGNRVLLLK